MSMCFVCDKDIDDDSDWCECDGCNSLFHLKCANVTKTEAKARKNSKCLKLYCPECFKAKTEGTKEKLKQIFDVMYKIDLAIQLQKTSIPELVSAFIDQKLNRMEKKIITNGMSCDNVNNESTACTVKAQSNKNNTIKPAIVIKPK